MLKVHPWIGSNPIELVDQFKKTAFNWNLASTITTIAMGAISFATVGASFFFTVPVSITVLGIVIPSLLSFATSFFTDRAIAMGRIVEQEEPVAVALKKILSWNESDILSFLRQHKIDVSPEIPLRSLLPLIARYQARCEQAEYYEKKSQELFLSTDISDREIRLWQRIEGWKYLEEIVLPSRIEAACVLEIFQHPTELLPHFYLNKKSFAERVFSRTFDKEDHYLQFSSHNREPISFDTLRNTSDPHSIHKLLRFQDFRNS